MDPKPPESDTPAAVEGEDFVHIRNLNIESLSDSMVRIDEPEEVTGSPFLDTAASASVSVSDQPTTLPDELSRNVVVLSCESAAESGVCDVYLVGTAHVSQVNKLLHQFISFVVGFILI